jgi:hypothetical protein
MANIIPRRRLKASAGNGELTKAGTASQKQKNPLPGVSRTGEVVGDNRAKNQKSPWHHAS